MIVDTHTHPYLDEYMPDKTESIRRAMEAGVRMMVMPNVDTGTLKPMKQLHALFPDNTAMAMGLHPTEIKESWRTDLSIVETELFSNANDYVAIGEIGIDLYWDKTFRAQQMEVLDIQLGWAYQLGLPAIIHCRDGLSETLDVMRSRAGQMPQVVFHSFGGTADDITAIRKDCPEPMFGINGIVTFKNSKLRNELSRIGTDHMLLETDAPYLAPVPHRGKRNESAYILATAAHIAEFMGLTTTAISELTGKNAMRFFNLTLK